VLWTRHIFHEPSFDLLGVLVLLGAAALAACGRTAAAALAAGALAGVSGLEAALLIGVEGAALKRSGTALEAGGLVSGAFAFCCTVVAAALERGVLEAGACPLPCTLDLLSRGFASDVLEFIDLLCDTLESSDLVSVAICGLVARSLDLLRLDRTQLDLSGL